eukprot:s6154_g1.t2
MQSCEGSQSGLLTPRLARHFVELFVPEPAEEDVKKMFMEVSRQILQAGGDRRGAGGNEGSSSARRYKVEDALALATLHLSKLMKDVLRQHAPARLGITSLRDVARLLQGVARAAPQHFTEKIQLAKLWAHEALRTFEDRIITDAGQRRFREVLSQQLETYFGMEPALEGLSFRLDASSGRYIDSDCQETRPLDSLMESWIAKLLLTVGFGCVGGWQDGMPSKHDGTSSRPPQQETCPLENCVDWSECTLRFEFHGLPRALADAYALRLDSCLTWLEEILHDLNGKTAEKGIAIPLRPFGDLLQHALRMARVLLMPSGHMLCIGPANSGRRTACLVGARLANAEATDVVSKLALRQCAKLHLAKSRAATLGERQLLVLQLVNGIVPWEALLERFLDTFHTIARHGHVQGAWTSEQQALRHSRGIHSFAANAATGMMMEHRGRVWCIKITADDKQAVSASADGSCIIWDLFTKTRKLCLFESTMFKSLVYHPDESQLLTTGSDRKVAYWDTFDGQAIRVLEGSEEGELATLSVSKSGSHYVSGGEERLLKLWDYDKGVSEYIGVGHSGTITCAAISPVRFRAG